jgi:hypothetical protein
MKNLRLSMLIGAICGLVIKGNLTVAGSAYTPLYLTDGLQVNTRIRNEFGSCGKAK